jgi:hypothetical protein
LVCEHEDGRKTDLVPLGNVDANQPEHFRTVLNETPAYLMKQAGVSLSHL